MGRQRQWADAWLYRCQSYDHTGRRMLGVEACRSIQSMRERRRIDRFLDSAKENEASIFSITTRKRGSMFLD